jgi:hypothetical protein
VRCKRRREAVLVLKVKPGDRVTVGEVTLYVVRSNGLLTFRLGIEAPDDVRIRHVKGDGEPKREEAGVGA